MFGIGGPNFETEQVVYLEGLAPKKTGGYKTVYVIAAADFRFNAFRS